MACGASARSQGGEAKFLRAVVRMFSQFVEVSKAQLGTMLPDTRLLLAACCRGLQCSRGMLKPGLQNNIQTPACTLDLALSCLCNKRCHGVNTAFCLDD